MIVETLADVHVTVTAKVQKRCPFVNEVDVGTVTIGWNADGQTIELHALNEYLASWEDEEFTHEAFTDSLVTHLSKQLNSEVSVRSEWVTAGMAVTVEAR